MSPKIDPTVGSATSLLGQTEAPPPAAAPEYGPPSDALDYRAPVEGPTTLFATGPLDVSPVDINDIRQGQMGDCYFVGALGALAKQRPSAIHDMIHENRDATGNVRSYTVDLYKGGAKVPVTVDAKWFSGGAAQLSDADGLGRREIWVRVIEKAYAQSQGGYPKIGHGGYAREAMEALTGLPAKQCAPEAYGFNQLRKDLADERLVCFSMTKPEGTARATPSQARLGLQGEHCYSVIDCKLEGGRQLVRLSNPWGNTQPGANEDGWVAYGDLMKDHNVSLVDVGTADRARDAVDAVKTFWKA